MIWVRKQEYGSAMKLLFAMLSSVLPSFLRVPLLRAIGWKIGHGVRLGWLSCILVKDVELQDGVRIAAFTFIRTRSLFMGPHSFIASFSLIRTTSLVIGSESRISRFNIVTAAQFSDQSSLTIGKRVAIYPFCWIDTTRAVTIEDDAGIGGSTYIFTHGSWQPIIDGFPVAFGEVVIERGVWLPWRIFILPDVTIGQYSTIGAGAVINRNVPAYSLAGGVPAKVLKADGEHIRRLSTEEKIELIRVMLRQAEDIFRFDGFQASITSTHDELVLTVDQARIVFQPSWKTVSDPVRIIISFERIPDALLIDLDRRHIGWIDVARRRCSDSSDPLLQSLRDVMSMYGTRFERTSAEDAIRLPDVEVSSLA